MRNSSKLIMTKLTLAICLSVFLLSPRSVLSESATAESITTDQRAQISLPLTLDECIQIALQHNFALQRARREIDRQVAKKSELVALALPKVELTSSIDWIDDRRIPSFEGAAFGSNRSWRADTELIQPLYAGGLNRAQITQQKLLLDSARHELLAAVNAKLFEVRQRFHDVALARDTVAVQELSVSLLSQELDRQNDRFEIGDVSRLDVIRAEVELANERTPLIQAKNNLRLALENLKVTLGDWPQVSLISSTSAEFPLEINDKIAGPNYELNWALEYGAKNRPEIKSLELAALAQAQGIDIAASGYYPWFDAYAGYGVESSPFNGDLSDTYEGWSAGIRANWRIFDSFETRSKVTQARAERRKAEISLREEQQRIDIEIRTAFSSYLEAKELLEASAKVVEQAKESLRLAHDRYTIGSVSQLDVLNARVAMTRAQTNQAEAKRAYNVSRADLERASGLQLENIGFEESYNK